MFHELTLHFASGIAFCPCIEITVQASRLTQFFDRHSEPALGIFIMAQKQAHPLPTWLNTKLEELRTT